MTSATSATLTGVTIRKKKASRSDKVKNLQPISEESTVVATPEDKDMELQSPKDESVKFHSPHDEGIRFHSRDDKDMEFNSRDDEDVGTSSHRDAYTSNSLEDDTTRPLPQIVDTPLILPQHNDDYGCQHVKMGVIHVAPNGPPGFLPCHVCNKVPLTGVLYYCQHDDSNDYFHSPLPYNLTDETDPQILELIHLGLSRSVIQQAKAGLYTIEQLEKLKAQKRGVHSLICQRLLINGSGSHTTPPIMEAISTTCYLKNTYYVSEAKGPTRVHTRDPTVKVKDFAATGGNKKPISKNPFFFQSNPPYPQSQARCYYKCCLGCWRNCHGRNFQSIDAVTTGDHELNYLEYWATKPTDTEYAPIANAEIPRKLDPFKKRWSWSDSDSSRTSETEFETSSDEGPSLKEELGLDEETNEVAEIDEHI